MACHLALSSRDLVDTAARQAGCPRDLRVGELRVQRVADRGVAIGDERVRLFLRATPRGDALGEFGWRHCVAADGRADAKSGFVIRLLI